MAVKKTKTVKTKSLSREELKEWKDKITVAERKFDAEMKKNIEKWRRFYKGDQFNDVIDDGDIEDDNAVVNMVYQVISTIVPSLVFKNPRLFAEAKKKPWIMKGGRVFDTVAAARAQEVVMNYYYGFLKTKRQTTKCLYDALLGPWGIMKLGFTSKVEKIKNGKELEVDELIKESSIFNVRVSPMDFLVDIKAKDHLLSDAEWIAFKRQSSLQDIKDNPTFENTEDLEINDLIDAKTFNTTDFFSSSDKKDAAGMFDIVTYWEIWDKKNKKIIVIVDDHDKTLQFRDWPWKIDGFPCEILYFNENPDEIFPVSDTATYLPELMELNAMRTILLDNAKRSETKYIMQKGFMNPDERSKLTDGPGGIIAVSDMSPASGGFQPYANKPVSQDVLFATRLLKNDIRETQAIAAFESGIAEKFDTATEAALVSQGVSIRREHRRDIIEDFTIRVVKKLSVILQQTLENDVSVKLNKQQFKDFKESAPERLEKIAGVQSPDLLPWLTLSSKDLLGDYEFSMELGSMQPINKETRKRDMKELVQLLASAPNLPSEVYRRIFDVFEIKDSEKLIESIQQAAQQRQQAQQQAQQAELQTELQKDLPKRQVDLEKTKMKVGKDIQVSKAKNATAQTIALLNALGNRGQKEK